MTSSPTPAVLLDARALIADVFRSWDMKRQADAYEAGSYDETLPMQALVARLSPPASDAAASGAGFVLVPVEPTGAMQKAGADAAFKADSHGDHWIARASAAWSAMLAAAPKAASDAAAAPKAASDAAAPDAAALSDARVRALTVLRRTMGGNMTAAIKSVPLTKAIDAMVEFATPPASDAPASGAQS